MVDGLTSLELVNRCDHSIVRNNAVHAHLLVLRDRVLCRAEGPVLGARAQLLVCLIEL